MPYFELILTTTVSDLPVLAARRRRINVSEEFKAGSILNVCLTYLHCTLVPPCTHRSRPVLQFTAGSPTSVTCVWHLGAGQGVMVVMETLFVYLSFRRGEGTVHLQCDLRLSPSPWNTIWTACCLHVPMSNSLQLLDTVAWQSCINVCFFAYFYEVFTIKGCSPAPHAFKLLSNLDSFVWVL